MEIEAQREVGVGGWQVRIDQIDLCSLHFDEIILRNLGSSWLTGNELNSKNDVGWSWRPRRAEWLVPRLRLEESLEGLEAGGWGIAGSVLVKHH